MKNANLDAHGPGMFMNALVLVGPYNEEVTEKDIAAIEQVLQHIDVKNSTLEALANWKLALKLFKKFEIGYTLSPNRSSMEKAHRAILTMFMGISEYILLASKCLDDSDFQNLRLTRQALEANVKYLQTKYNQWYAPWDRAILGETAATIENARAAAS